MATGTPKTAAGLVVGVTGHRRIVASPPLVGGVRQALAVLGDGRRLHILTSLAEGADRLVVDEARRLPGTTFAAILPFPAGRYEADFASDASRAEFRALLERAEAIEVIEAGESPEACYEAAGREVMRRSDVLLALWDGLPSQGTGGTGQIGQEAIAEGKPVIIVRTGNRKPGTDEATEAPDQGRLILRYLTDRFGEKGGVWGEVGGSAE